MKKWKGAAGVCINDNGELLMVKQGKPEEPKTWSVPSGGLEDGETLEECCVREVREETGYQAEVIEKLFVKKTELEGYDVEVHYFIIRLIGGKSVIQDPDGLIHAIEWVSYESINKYELSFPEDLEFLKEQLNKRLYSKR